MSFLLQKNIVDTMYACLIRYYSHYSNATWKSMLDTTPFIMTWDVKVMLRVIKCYFDKTNVSQEQLYSIESDLHMFILKLLLLTFLMS